MFKTKDFLKFTSLVVVLINVFLILSKLLVYTNTQSVAVFSSLMDSILDLTLSSLNGLVLIYAVKPKDDDHRFGHSAIEDVIALFQILLIVCAGVSVFYSSLQVVNKDYIFSWFSVGVMIFNMIPLLCIILLQKHAQRKTKSTILKADSLHYTGDFITMLGTVLAMIISHYTKIIWFDILCGALIMISIFYSATGGAIEAFNNLMARELQDGTRETVEEILQKSNEIISYKGLRTRSSGQMRFIQFDILLNQNISLQKAHEIAHTIEDRIKESIQNVDIIIHMEPLD